MGAPLRCLCLGRADTAGTIAVADDALAGKKLTPDASGGVSAIEKIEMETIAAENVAHGGAGMVDGRSRGDYPPDTCRLGLLPGGKRYALIHALLVVAVISKSLVAAILGVSPSHMPHNLYILVGSGGQYIRFQPPKVGVSVRKARIMAGLLQGNDVPRLVFDDVVETGVADGGGMAAHNLAVAVFGLSSLCILPMPVYRTAPDIGVSDNKTVALGGGELVEILLNGIL